MWDSGICHDERLMNDSDRGNTAPPRQRRPDHSKSGPPGHAPRREKKAPKKITETYLHNAGLYYLQRYAASTAQFRNVMQRKIDTSCRHHADQDKDACRRMLEDMIVRFSGNGLLNDAVYLRGMVHSLRRRGLSQRMIVTKLQSKGLGEAEIEDALASFNEENQATPDSVEWAAAVKLARKKKLGPYATGPVDAKKAMAAMARAGFSFDLCRRVLALGADDVEDL